VSAHPASNRLDYLDAVRAFALLLGIVFHASISFMPIFIGWAVMDVSTSHVVSVFMLISHSFRMELFFLIAGFFSHMTYHGKGFATFAKSRFLRIAIPFVVGWFLLRPLLVSGWIMGGESLRGDVDVAGALKGGFESLASLPQGLFVGTHLWFLYYLLLITALVLVLRRLLCLHAPTKARLTRIADASASWLSNSPFAIVTVAVPTTACLWFMNSWGMDTPDQSLLPHAPVLFVYGGFFAFGWLLHRQGRLIERFARLGWGRFAVCAAAALATLALAGFQANAGHPQFALLKAAFSYAYAIMMWSLVALSIGLFKRYLDRPSKAVRYVADSSYWLYLVHLPIVIWLQVAVAELNLHWSAKLLGISAVTIAGAVVLYDLFVRSTFIGATLNGRRRPRVLFPFGKGKRTHSRAPAGGTSTPRGS